MTDLHSHILPGIDDGAPDVQTALRLLEMESVQGVRNIALTSHYHSAMGDLEAFLERRAWAWTLLKGQLGELADKLNLKLGCEVRYSPKLMNQPIHRLCMQGTDVVLLELPTDHKPTFLGELLGYLQADGLIPVIAHVERYRYVFEDPRLLAEWVQMGAYAQVNGATLLRTGEQAEMAMKLIKWNLVHVIATDTHSPDKRPPILRQALRQVDKELGKQKAAWLRQNADALFNGMVPEYRKPHVPKRIFGAWL